MVKLLTTLCLLLTSLASAAGVSYTTATLVCTSGTCVLTTQPMGEKYVVYSFACASNSAGITYTTNFPSLVGELVRVTTNPGATAPTDNYDIELDDSDGFDVLCGKGANRDTANTESVIPLLGDGTSVTHKVTLAGSHTLSVTNAGSAKVFVLKLYVKRD